MVWYELKHQIAFCASYFGQQIAGQENVSRAGIPACRLRAGIILDIGQEKRICDHRDDPGNITGSWPQGNSAAARRG